MGRARRWTDDDLRDAVAEAEMLSDVLRRLGLSKGGATVDVVRRRMLELGLDEPYLLRRAMSSKWATDPGDAGAHAPVAGRWTDDELRMAVLASTSMKQVLEHLGRPASGVAWTAAKARILELGVDTSHFTRRRPRARDASTPTPSPSWRRWSTADLEAAVTASTSVAGVLRQLGLHVGGAVYVAIQGAIREAGLDTSHFTGQGWRKGSRRPVRQPQPLSAILVQHSTYSSTHTLRLRLIREGVKEARCEECRRTQWNGAPIALQLDHVNGDRTDNRLENIRLLCPNCHAQTDTWCGKNRGRYDRLAPVLQLVDRPGSKSGAFGHEGSTPSGRTATDPQQLRLSGLDDLD